MLKADAIRLLGGTVTAAARAMEISQSAVSQWPDVLKKCHIIKVQAALFRRLTQCTSVQQQPQRKSLSRK